MKFIENVEKDKFENFVFNHPTPEFISSRSFQYSFNPFIKRFLFCQYLFIFMLCNAV